MGFTIIELLVSVAIIALLMAILIPTLSRVKGQGKATKCAANLHGIGQSSQLYIADYNGWVGTGTGELAPYNAIYQNRTASGVKATSGDRLMLCPETLVEGIYYPSSSQPMNYAFNSGRILVGQAGIIYASSTGRKKFSEFARPGETWYSADSAQLMTSGKNTRLTPATSVQPPFDSESSSAKVPVMREYPLSGSTNSDTLFHGRHSAKGSVLWYDGHVTLEKPYLSEKWSQNFKDLYNLGLLTPIAQSVGPDQFITRPYKEQDYYYLMR